MNNMAEAVSQGWIKLSQQNSIYFSNYEFFTMKDNRIYYIMDMKFHE